jgi:hypothetical protein
MRADAAHASHRTDDVLGWARITVHDQGDASAGRPPMFEGAFSVRGVTHHITLLESYLRNRGVLDPHPYLTPSALDVLDLEPDVDFYTESDRGLVIWRDTDVMDAWEEHAVRTGVSVDYARDRRSLTAAPEPARCGHDALAWNSDPALNSLLRPLSGSSWYNPFGLFAGSPSRRDDIAGPGAGSK